MIYDPSIFRAYDVRGIYPGQMNEKVAYAAGQAFVQVMGAKRVLVGRDVRSTGPSLQAAAIEGIRDAGATAIDIGVISTEMLYFASATLDCDGGLSITASHNPAEWNGFKCVSKNGIPLTRDEKLGEIYDFIQSSRSIEQFEKGKLETVDLLPAYSEYLHKFLPADLPMLSIVANVNFGANGKVVDAAVAPLTELTVSRLNWNEDGTFPKGPPDPMQAKNRAELCQQIIDEGADFGVAWDADADRCFLYDEKGRWFHGYYISAFLVKHFLEENPGATAVVERRLAWANIDAAKEAGGKTEYSLTGHGFFKRTMREFDAVFGAETSGHFYFKDFWYCDNGMLTFLTALKIFGKHIKGGGTVSDLLDYYLEHYPISGELNFTTDMGKEIIKKATTKYSDAKQDLADGISAEYPDWRLNLRLSNGEPLMRMNLEARSQEKLKEAQDELMQFLTAEGAQLRNEH
ncbi:MAG: phosphomannomutase/phosphoglucomutase [bacterium]